MGAASRDGRDLRCLRAGRQGSQIDPGDGHRLAATAVLRAESLLGWSWRLRAVVGTMGGRADHCVLGSRRDSVFMGNTKSKAISGSARLGVDDGPRYCFRDLRKRASPELEVRIRQSLSGGSA